MAGTTFEIIMNSESNTGYDIEDKKYFGLIPGLCCGWQYEYIDAKGEYHYSSVAYMEESAEDYADKWTGYRGSWLLDMLPDDYKFSGRVIFRGYAESYYDYDEHESYVEEVDDEKLQRYLNACGIKAEATADVEDTSDVNTTNINNADMTAMFEKLLELEHSAEHETYDGHNYAEQVQGAYEMLKILGLDSVYIKWSYGK